MAQFVPETGGFTSLEFGEEWVTKTSLAHFSYYRALSVAASLHQYTDNLAQEPISVAAVRDIGVVDCGVEGFAVQHSMRLVGKNIRKLKGDAFRVALSQVVGSLCSMSTIRSEEPGVLRVPVDSLIRNWHMDGDSPTLVDVFPPMIRNRKNEISCFWVQTRNDQRMIEELDGRLGGIIPELLLAAAPPLPKPACRDWCLDLLPRDMAPPLRAHLTQKTNRQIDELFL